MLCPLNFLVLSFGLRRSICCRHATSQLCVTNFVGQSTSWKANDSCSLIAISLSFSYVICYLCTSADMQIWHKPPQMKFYSTSIHALSSFFSPHYDKWLITVTSQNRYVAVLQKTRCFWCFKVCRWARCFRNLGGAGRWGTTLRSGRSRVRFPMVLLEFFIDVSLPPALWSWGRVSL